MNEIVLEPLLETHLQHLSGFLQLPEVRAFLDLPSTAREFSKLAEHCNALESLGWGAYRAIVATSKNPDPGKETQVAGLIGFHLPATLQHTAVLGTWLLDPFRGTGANALAKQTMIHLAFGKFAVKRVVWFIATHNARALKASAKLPYVERLDPDSMDVECRAYQKWLTFKTGQPSVVFQVRPDAFYASAQLKIVDRSDL
jgi:RimJ/RimL family protein N-acetyltransferase